MDADTLARAIDELSERLEDVSGTVGIAPMQWEEGIEPGLEIDDGATLTLPSSVMFSYLLGNVELSLESARQKLENSELEPASFDTLCAYRFMTLACSVTIEALVKQVGPEGTTALVGAALHASDARHAENRAKKAALQVLAGGQRVQEHDQGGNRRMGVKRRYGRRIRNHPRMVSGMEAAKVGSARRA